MDRFVDLTLGGLAGGSVHAAVALALVLIWRSTRVVNFAQGGMLMVTTFVAWTVIDHTGSYPLALAAALGSGLLLGAVVERVLVRWVEDSPNPLDAVMVSLGLLVLLQALAGMIWGGRPRSFPPAFGIEGFTLGDRRVLFGPSDLFAVLAVAVVAIGLLALFRLTPVGLRMRAAAFAPETARILGVRVGRTLTLGWALAAAVGALAGLLVAPKTFVSPNAFDVELVLGFTAAVVGGLDSPVGAVVGGLLLGLLLSYLSGYAGSDVVTLGALGILVLVLLVRPQGLVPVTAGRRV